MIHPLAFTSRRSIVLALALTSALTSVACAPTEEDEGSQASDLSTRTCGVGPADQAAARKLNDRLNGKLARSMTAERVACAREIVRTTLLRGLGPRAAQIAVAASIAETSLDNVTFDDGTYGVFRRRPGQGWGQPAQLLDPGYATNAFLDAMTRALGDQWRVLAIGQVAQRVQQSLPASRYEQEKSDAELIVDSVRGTRCGGAFAVVGEIEDKFLALGGCSSFLGVPTTEELVTPDGRGRFTVFTNGSIYWRADLGAHEVHGAIRDKWRDFGWEAGALGYPLSDESRTPDGRGHYSVFEGGSVYWTATTGAHEVRGAIRDTWRDLGWEAGVLGYPTAGEREVPGGIRSAFEHGALTWTRATGKVTVERY